MIQKVRSTDVFPYYSYSKYQRYVTVLDVDVFAIAKSSPSLEDNISVASLVYTISFIRSTIFLPIAIGRG